MVRADSASTTAVRLPAGSCSKRVTLTERVSGGGQAVERGFVREGPDVAGGIGEPRDVARGVVREPADAAQRICRRRHAAGGIALVAGDLPEAVDPSRCRSPRCRAGGSWCAPWIRDGGRRVSAGRPGVGEGPDAAVGLRLPDHATERIVLVGEEGDAARVRDGRDATGGIVGVSRDPSGRIRDGLEAEGRRRGVSVPNDAADRIGHVQEPDGAGDEASVVKRRTRPAGSVTWVGTPKLSRAMVSVLPGDRSLRSAGSSRRSARRPFSG